MVEWVKRQAGWQSLFSRVKQRTRHADSEDFLQSALLNLLEKGSLHVRNIDAYIVRSAQNAACDAARRSTRTPLTSISENTYDEIACTNPLPEEVFISSERLERLQAAVNDLPSRTREIFILHRSGDLSYQEIALQLSCSISSVEKHISKALAYLTKCLLD